MNVFIQVFVLLELVEQLLCVASYTVVLKQVKPLHPSVKVYRYELRHPKIISDATSQYIYHKPVLGQRIYPVVLKPQRDANFRPRVPVKKDKRKFLPKPTEKPLPRDPPLYGLSQELVPPVSNQIEEYSEGKEEETQEQENDIRPLLASPHDEKSFGSFGQEKGRIYNKPGDWATPAPAKDSENTTSAFTPSQLYLQIRHKNTVIHVPQSEALKDAETLEELINAPRLKELARTTHVQEVYSEEGYEDAGYDHAGHIRHAQHGEVYDAKDEGKFKIKDPPIILDYDSDLEESKKIPLRNDHEDNSADDESKPEPRITRSRMEKTKTSVEYAKIPQTYKGDHKYSSRVKNPVKIEDHNLRQFNSTESKNLPQAEATFPSYFGEMPPGLETAFKNDSVPSFVPVGKKSSKYRKGEFNSTKIYPVSDAAPTSPTADAKEFTDFKPFIAMIDSQASPSAKSLKYSRIYSKKTKQLSLQPYKTGNVYEPALHQDLQPPPPSDKTLEEESINERIVLPTIGYINSLTTAHFGKGAAPPSQEDSKTQLTSALNLTEALNYLRSNKSQKSLETPKLSTEVDIRTFEPMRLKSSRTGSRKFSGKTKRDVYLMRERDKRSGEDYEGNDESDAPHNEKNEEIAEDERKRIEEENREKEKYAAELNEEISKQETEIIRETLKNIGVEEDISEAFPDFPPSGASPGDSYSAGSETTPTPIDPIKYPFYFSNRLPENSALRYATDPKKFPRKSGYKMEFYESREGYIQCPDFHPDLEDLPDSNSTEYSDTHAGENQRLAGVGDKIACLRMKYFDRDPFDNPIFKEREIDYVGKTKKGSKKFHKKVVPSQSRAVPSQLKSTNHRNSSTTKTKTQKPFLYLFNINTTAYPPKKLQTPNRGNQVMTKIPQTARSQPGKPQNVFVLPQPTKLKTSETEEPRAVPVAEATAAPYPTYFAQTLPQPRPYYVKTLRPTPPTPRKRIVIPYNCMHSISQLSVLDGTKNLVIDCNDAILIQEVVNGKAHLRIISKETEKNRKREFSDQTDWVPIVGYVLPRHANESLKPLSRKTDEVTLSKNGTTQNTSSDHYVIDELKEDETVRKGEVVEDMDHYMKMMDDAKTEKPEETSADLELPKTENVTRRKREAQNDVIKFTEISPRKWTSGNVDLGSRERVAQSQNPGRSSEQVKASKDGDEPVVSRPFEHKRKLTRLSGIDFLVRYHKKKSKPDKTTDFWKVTTDKKPETKKPSAVEKPKIEFETKREDKLQSATPANPVKRNQILKDNPELQATTKKYTNKPKAKHTNEPRKISPLNLIPEKITKKPETKPEPRKSLHPVTTTTKPFLQNSTKIITKVSRERSETSEKPRIVHKKLEKTSQEPIQQPKSPETTTGNSVTRKPETPHYQTLDRGKTNPKKEDSEEVSRYIETTEGPILYYVVDLRTGRGKWITDYDEGKLRKNQKRGKRRKKPKF